MEVGGTMEGMRIDGEMGGKIQTWEDRWIDVEIGGKMERQED
jgi:hypothetical protein